MKNLCLQINQILAVVLLTTSLGFSQEQTYLSESWSGQGGEMAVFYQNVTKTDIQRNVYVAGSTLNDDNNNDIILQKFDPNGNLLWQETFNGAANMDDMAADMFVDDAMNIYITGTSIASVNSDFDLVVLKYNSSGQLQWTHYYDNGGSPDPQDAGTSIVGDSNGSIFVTGASFGSNTLSDYVTLRLNASNGNTIWTERYDYSQLNEIPSKIQISGSKVLVSGGSQVSLAPNSWELATLIYQQSDGTLLSTHRSTGSATSGTDEIHDIAVDGNGNFYLAGSVVDASTGHDIALYKLDDELNLIWEQTWDGYGNDDKGHGVKLDSQGNIYIAGYTETNAEGDNFALLKYSNSGALIWERQFNGEANLDDRARQLVIDSDDRIYVTGDAINTDNSDFQTVGYSPSGDIFAQTTFDGPEGMNDKPSAIALDLDGDLIIVGQTQTPSGWKNYTVKYAVYKRSLTPVLVNGEPSHVEDELLIRFDKSVVNYNAIDNKRFQAGKLNEFVSQSVINQMNQKLGFDCSRLETFKIFRRMTTADSVSVTRLGDTRRLDDFWTILSVYFPKEADLSELSDSLETLTDHIRYAELDIVGEVFGQPNDALYLPEQTGLFDPIHGINAEDAWDTQVGQEYTKVGIFDTGINWRHEDFGDGSWVGSKIAGGWDFVNNATPENQDTPDINGHGTALAGIVGALRNNSIGVAGVAGGDVQNGNTGCQLFSMKVTPSPDQMGGIDGSIEVFHSLIAPAIVEGAADNPNTGFGYGLHIQNHSWGHSVSTTTLLDAVKSCFYDNCLFVASSGNTSAATLNFPASFNSDWVLKVGANDETGQRAQFSTFGPGLDVIAPGTANIYASLDEESNLTYSHSEDGTSFAAPHVAGVAALLHSQHHVDNGYDNNLAPEDYQEIINQSARDVMDPGYDQFSGNGIVDAENSLLRVTLPQFHVKHGGGQNQMTTTMDIEGALINVTSQPNISAGAYFANRYKVQNSWLFTLDETQLPIDVWRRHSSSIGVYDFDPVTGTPYFDMGVTYYNEPNQNQVSVSTTTYCWQITGNILGQQFNAWIPAHPSELRTEFSIHVQDNIVTGNSDIAGEQFFNVYPNPTGGDLTVDFSGFNALSAEIEFMDQLGRVVHAENLSINGATRTIQTFNLSGLAGGIYLCTLKAGDQTLTKKFFKQN